MGVICCTILCTLLAVFIFHQTLKRVGVWDVTEEKYGRTNRYEDVSFTFRKLCSDDYSLSCMALINCRGLGAGDQIYYVGILLFQSLYSN